MILTLRHRLALLGLLLVAPDLAAQDDLERHGIFLDSIDVNLVTVEVTVVDADGRSVTGLTSDEFTVQVDGEEVPVTHFHAVEAGERRRPETPAVATDGSREPACVVLFVDNANIASHHRQRVFAELSDRLDGLMGAADRVLVASQDREVGIVQPFTGDRALVRAALDRLRGETSAAGLRPLEEQRLQNLLLDSASQRFGDANDRFAEQSGNMSTPEVAATALQHVRSYADQASLDLARTLAALDHFVSSLAGLPGKKALVYVSDGLELRPGERLFRLWEDVFRLVQGSTGVGSIESEIERYAHDARFDRLLGNASANRVAFYTVGYRGSEMAVNSTERGDAVTSGSVIAADGGRAGSLVRLADQTGGRALLGDARIDALLDHLEQDLTNYYSLGFPAPHPANGAQHAVEIEIARPGLELRYLKTYRSKGIEERTTDRTLAALLFDVGDNPLDVQVELGERTPAEKGEVVVPVMVKIPLSKLVLVPQQDAHVGRLSIYVVVQDARGRTSEPQRIEVPVHVPNDQMLAAMSQTAGYLTRLRMRSGEQKIAVGVRDELAAETSTLNLRVEIGTR